MIGGCFEVMRAIALFPGLIFGVKRTRGVKKPSNGTKYKAEENDLLERSLLISKEGK